MPECRREVWVGIVYLFGLVSLGFFWKEDGGPGWGGGSKIVDFAL